MPTLFITGYPGFLASELVPRLLAADDSSRIVCLVEDRFIELARTRRSTLPLVYQHRLHFVEGDITRDGLGIEPGAVETESITEIFHLAAIYDLQVDVPTATAVNLVGTRHVIDFAHGCRSLTRLHYMSTCYVSGRFEGVFTENHLICGQSFNNHYEESKYRAEVEVQAAMHGGMQTTIYRPSIVVGDSTTGAIQKFDGPYPLIRWMLRTPYMAVLPTVGRLSASYVNFVPSDFVIAAVLAISRMESSTNQVFHLADPHLLTVGEAISLLGQATDRRIVRVPLSAHLARRAIRQVGRIDQSIGLHAALIDYFRHPTRYSTESTRRALEDTGISCPPFAEYVDRLVAYVRSNPPLSAAA